ncbi:putative quinol monooxygenase [Oricola indica]|jgi:quinol monooxygenase YgiN|uniref:putative quinol monooxygenase n=1 Tax=Oricola indica TaxID=2872591 RepID=UPI001CBD522A|nr:putative quinol monooxygenase [Oricola indica]
MTHARLLVELDVKPDEADSFAAMFEREFISRSRAEEGCLRYELWRETENNSRMTIIEIWNSQSDLDRHLAQPWFAEWAPKMEAAQATPLKVRVMSAVGE